MSLRAIGERLCAGGSRAARWTRRCDEPHRQLPMRRHQVRGRERRVRRSMPVTSDIDASVVLAWEVADSGGACRQSHEDRLSVLRVLFTRMLKAEKDTAPCRD